MRMAQMTKGVDKKLQYIISSHQFDATTCLVFLFFLLSVSLAMNIVTAVKSVAFAAVTIIKGSIIYRSHHFRFVIKLKQEAQKC